MSEWTGFPKVALDAMRERDEWKARAEAAEADLARAQAEAASLRAALNALIDGPPKHHKDCDGCKCSCGRQLMLESDGENALSTTAGTDLMAYVEVMEQYLEERGVGLGPGVVRDAVEKPGRSAGGRMETELVCEKCGESLTLVRVEANRLYAGQIEYIITPCEKCMDAAREEGKRSAEDEEAE